MNTVLKMRAYGQSLVASVQATYDRGKAMIAKADEIHCERLKMKEDYPHMPEHLLDAYEEHRCAEYGFSPARTVRSSASSTNCRPRMPNGYADQPISGLFVKGQERDDLTLRTIPGQYNKGGNALIAYLKQNSDGSEEGDRRHICEWIAAREAELQRFAQFNYRLREGVILQ